MVAADTGFGSNMAIFAINLGRGDHVSIGPRRVLEQFQSLKNWTWSERFAEGVAAVQSW